ncbi:hypothetical protein TI39_contig456g00005 [Zymoseptoria brevis]|uniref:Uncharacterized protein n=1 Tax=Zymoseptoria brevis TaxID=1047168 RepID=A0A0F4GK99_9PEZI|nr:hypothetical protein TI39_contig456g00005 [Zymoseptoria brevis]
MSLDILGGLGGSIGGSGGGLGAGLSGHASNMGADLSAGANGMLQSGADTAGNLLSGAAGDVGNTVNGLLGGGGNSGNSGSAGDQASNGDNNAGADSHAGNTWKAPPKQAHGDDGANGGGAGGLTTSASIETPPCTIQGGPAKVIYFPATIVPGQDGIGEDGMCTTMNTVLNPKSCYFSYSTLWAGYTDGETYKTVGPTYANTMVACPSSEVSTRCAATQGAAVNWDDYHGDSQPSCTDFAPPAAMMTMVPEWGFAPEYSMTYEAPQNPMVPAQAPAQNTAAVPAPPPYQSSSNAAPAPAPATGVVPHQSASTSYVQPMQSTQPASYTGGSRSERRVGWVVPAVGFVVGLATFALNM